MKQTRPRDNARLLDTGNPNWGYKALSRGISFKGRFKTGEKPELFREFVQLKEGHGLYGIFPGAIKITPLTPTRSMVRASFHLPTRVPQGVHRVCLTVVRDGHPVERGCIPFTVVLAGLPAFLSFLASQRVVFYGILSVAVAVAGGFLSGALFKMRRGGQSKKGDPCEEIDGAADARCRLKKQFLIEFRDLQTMVQQRIH